MVTSSSSLRPLITGTSVLTARLSAPSRRPSSSSQCSRAACTSVKGRRSSTTMATRLGSSRTTSARRISRHRLQARAHRARDRSARGSDRGGCRRPRGSRWGGTREAPRTSTATTAKRAVVRSPVAGADDRRRRGGGRRGGDQHPRTSGCAACGRRRRTRPTRWPATEEADRPRSPRARAGARGVVRPLLTENPDLGLEHDAEVRRARARGSSPSGPGRRPAMAPPRLTMKLACLAEISAPLMRLPLSPAFSSSRAAWSLGGFFHTQPAEASASGCVDFFCFSRCLMSFWISACGRRCSCSRQPISTEPRRRVEDAVRHAGARLELAHACRRGADSRRR